MKLEPAGVISAEQLIKMRREANCNLSHDSLWKIRVARICLRMKEKVTCTACRKLKDQLKMNHSRV